MDEALIENWNSVVQDGDEVIVVGDLAMGQREETVPLASRLRGRKILVPGNHDYCHPMHKHFRDSVPLYEAAGFEIVEPQIVIQLGGKSVQVCHFPYFGDSKPSGDRYSGQRPDDDGGWLICGHVHDAWTVKNKMVNVGVDVWEMTPVPEDWILDIIEGRKT